ncbi:MAG: tRNA (adenosine(37)-N6)-dimethylallyltransferase MiaA [Acidimicrobiales bacterium]
MSVDSMQVYRGMDIGTAKPTPAEQAEVRHHLIDLAEPDDRFTVTKFAAAAAQALEGIEARGHRAIVVGGTGLYLQALLGDVDPPGEWPELKVELQADAARDGAAALHARLRALDPDAAARMEPGNVRRIVRALEVTLGSGRPFSSFGPGVDAFVPRARFALVGVWLPRTVLAERIIRRVQVMFARGLEDEVHALDARLGPTARQALGYKEILAGLAGDTAQIEIAARTRGYARRQRAWFRRDPRIRWHGTAADPALLLPGLLAELDRCAV